MTQYEGFRLERDGHVAIATIANPPANTWSRQSLWALERLVVDLDADREIFALVITGEGPKFFSAGLDLKQLADGDRLAGREFARAFGSAFEALSRFRGVTIAAINGYAMGGGIECALACDLRIAEEHAVLALPETGVGLLPCGGGTQILPRLVGDGWAKRMILLGERVDAATALRIGLVEEVAPAGGALAKALDWARQAGRQSPIAVAHSKRLIQSARGAEHQGALLAERELFVDLFETRDNREGIAAFLEKRSPTWTNS